MITVKKLTSTESNIDDGRPTNEEKALALN